MKIQRTVLSCSFSALICLSAAPAFADCSALPGLSQLRSALIGAIVPDNGGLGNNMWGTIVDDGGTVCVVAFSGKTFTSQWLGSRVIAAQKANTANDFSLGIGSGGTVIALSTANLFTAVQPGGSLYGLQHSNPVDTAVAYGNQPLSSNGVSTASFAPGPFSSSSFGTTRDPMVGQRIGGVNVFGGGLALYKNGSRVGGLGVSGDTSCTDHMVAWRVRSSLKLDQFGAVGGVAGGTHPDNIIFDIQPNTDLTGGTGQSPAGEGGVGHSTSPGGGGGFGHPKCLNNPTDTAVANLPAVQQ